MDSATMQLPGVSTGLYKGRSAGQSAATTGLIAALRSLPAPVVGRLRSAWNDETWDVEAVVDGLDRGVKSVEGVCEQVLSALAIEGENEKARGVVFAEGVTEAVPVVEGEALAADTQSVSHHHHDHSEIDPPLTTTIPAAVESTSEMVKRAVVEFESLSAEAARARIEAECAMLEYFLEPRDLGDVLTIDVDQDLLHERLGQPKERIKRGYRGRKRAEPDEGGRGRVGVDVVPSKWTAKTQEQLCMLITCILGTAPLHSYGSMTKMTRKLASRLQYNGVCQGMQSMGATLDEVRTTLSAGGYADPDSFLSAAELACKDAVDTYLLDDNPGVRKGKLVGCADAFVNALSQSTVDLLGLAKPKKIKVHNKAVAGLGFYAQQTDPEKPAVKLPNSIAFNKEPFRHGPWRKTPFKPRPYVRLEEYEIVEEFARDDIALKLKSEKLGSCPGGHCTDRQDLGHYSLQKGGFVSKCGCLSRNMECSDRCGCDPASCLNRAVSNRNAVRIGVDVDEIDSWGMDCYTRKNIHDAALESQAFGSYVMEEMTRGDLREGRAAVDGSGGELDVGMDPDVKVYDETNGGAKGDGNELTASANASNALNALNALNANNATPAPVTVDKAGQDAARRAASEWIELVLIPAINKQGKHGWDLHRALDHVIECASSAEPSDAEAATSLAAAKAVKAKLDLVGPLYFRLHPKGVGLVCKRDEGLPPLTFIEEYLGEIHLPWRWFELQDAVKRITGSELPDFYNIVLERPTDDPAGYDVLFVDAAAKGAVASRMSHSCMPNCQAVVMSCNGRLTIAVYTLRHVHPGEELTFDYSSVTESEKEFKQAICLCGTHQCRGSYLYFTGNKAFMQILQKKHNVLHRQVLLTRAGSEPLDETDAARLRRFGLGSSCLGSREDGTRVPEWLEKWTSLICEYLEAEETCLREELLTMKRYDEVTASAEAKGVIMNRVQNIVITLDKIRMVLKQPTQTTEPPLRRMTDSQVASHLWNGSNSISKRLLKGCAALLVPVLVPIETSPQQALTILVTCSECGDEETLKEIPEALIGLAFSAQKVASSAQDARDKLMAFSDDLRELDVSHGGGMTAAADLGVLYASTTNWVKASQEYKSFVSPKVPINLEDLFLNREAEAELDAEDENRLVTSAQIKAKKHENHPALQKSYRPMYVWGQLNSWFKQTVNDPTASLSADRRGCVSMPDIDSAFKTGFNYLQKDRNPMLEQIETKPDSMWRTGSMWQFKNDAKCYGSPMLDQAWLEVTGEGFDPMPGTIAKLREAKLPKPCLPTIVRPM